MNEGSYHLADSTKAYIALPSVAAYQLGTTDFTVEAWVQTYSGGPILGIMATTSSPGFCLQINPGTIELNTQDGTSYAQASVSGVSICDGMWHHVAAVRTAAEFLIYLDSVAVPVQQSTNGTPPLNINSSDRMTLGAVDNSSISNQHYDGMLSEVRFWNEARAAHDIPVDAQFRLQANSIKDKNAGTVHGQLIGCGAEPPQRGPNVETLFYIYYGIYAMETETSTGTWTSAGQLAVTSTGFVVLNESTVLKGAKYHGAELKWSNSGNQNPSSGKLKFKMNSSDTTYWPTRQLGELFEGSMQPNGSASVNVRGTIMPKRLGCGIVLNIGTGLVLQNKSGTAVVSPVIGAAPGNFCRYSGDKLYDMSTQLAIQAHAAGPGHSVQFVAPDPSQDGLQSFDFNSSENAVLKSSPTVALGVNGAKNVVTVPLDTTDDSQKWLALSGSKIFWNSLATSAVLSGNGTNLNVVTKSDGNTTQSWYNFRDSFFSAATNFALTVSGAPAPGVPLCLAKWSPANTSQEFVLRGGLLIHKPSDLIAMAQGTIVVLAEKDSNKQSPGAQWSISEPCFSGSNGDVNQLDPAPDEADDLVTYKITIKTGSWWFSGTNDQVEVSLTDWDSDRNPNARSLEYRILNTMDHSPAGKPFQTGRTDTFTFQDRAMNEIKYVYIIHGRTNWFFQGRWVCDQVQVHQSNKPNGWGFNTLRDRMGDQIGMIMDYFEMVPMEWNVPPTDAKMCLSWAMAKDAIGQSMNWDHTWITVVSDADPSRTIYFDCAGGHGGDDGMENVIQRRCKLNNVVLMSTGEPISPEHPLKSAYGTNRTDGKDNANLRADGKINWDGQCHQIANRYLFMTPAQTCIDDAPVLYWPNGYMLSCAVFGRYGVNFPAWCRRINLSDVPDDSYNNLYFWVQQCLGGRTDQIKRILSLLQIYKDKILHKTNPQPNDAETTHLVKSIYNEGESLVQMAELLTLPVTVIEELLDSDSDVRAGIDWGV